MFELSKEPPGKWPDPKLVWETMQLHKVSFEDIADNYEISEKEYIKLKEEVKEFDKNVVYPYIVKGGNVDVHLDGKSAIHIPYEKE